MAVKILQAGGLIIFPTETVYGAGVDATNQTAVNKLLAYKTRREGKPLSIAVADKKNAKKYVVLNQQAEKIYDNFLPGPVTVVSQSLNQVASGVASEFGTLGVRIPNYALMLKILRIFGKPMTATSANASGKKRPYLITDLLNQLSTKQKKLIDLVLDAGQLPKNEPSTVIDTTLSTPVTLRKGAMNNALLHLSGSELISHSEEETQKIALTLMLKNWEQIKKTGLVIGLEGKLGAGKTIFAKGVAKFLQINAVITSPTYSYLEEYEYQKHGVKGKFNHLDLWKIDQVETLRRLKINQLIKPNSVVLIEWWRQGEKHLLTLIKRQECHFLAIKISLVKHKNNDRKLCFHEVTTKHHYQKTSIV